MINDAEIRELVLARLASMPKNIGVHLGSNGTLTREDLIRHVKKDDALGKKIVETQLAYLRAMKDL
ncbi:MAG: hypothetical protein AABX02_00965 [archaeon]